MSSIVFQPDTQETRYAANQLARKQAIIRLEADILMDMQICEIEGWDKLEYIRQLQELLNSLTARRTK